MQDAIHELLAAVRRLAVGRRQRRQLLRAARQDHVPCTAWDTVEVTLANADDRRCTPPLWTDGCPLPTAPMHADDTAKFQLGGNCADANSPGSRPLRAVWDLIFLLTISGHDRH